MCDAIRDAIFIYSHIGMLAINPNGYDKVKFDAKLEFLSLHSMQFT